MGSLFNGWSAASSAHSAATVFRRALAAAATALLAACATVPLPGRLLGLSAEPPPTAQERSQLTADVDCAEHRHTVHGGESPAERHRAMDREVLAYQALAEETLAMRAQAIRLRGELRAKVDRREPLSGRDLKQLNETTAAMLDLRAALFRVSLAHECWLDDPVAVDPRDAEIQAMGIAMSLSAALVLYDNYLSAISLYRSDTVLRQHLNRPDSGFAIRDGELNRIAVSFASPDNRARVRRGIAWYEKYGRPDSADDDPAYRYLVQLIEQSPSRQMVRMVRPLTAIGNVAGFFSTLSFDTLLELKNEGINVTSMLFGNTVGLVEVRRGKLDGRPEVLAKLTAEARAGDILLEKTPFRLTDTLIPGHWGHAAVWVGSEAELRDLGIWAHPVVRAHHDAIRSGRGVVEALRSGVEMSTLAQFLNVDDVALLRQGDLTDAMRAEIVLQALRQVGKAYDFNFDVESTDRIVCSELVYHAYGHLDWPTSRVLGRVTISPDNVAVRATGKGPLKVAVLYHDGEEITTMQHEAMEKLVQADVVRLARP